MLWSPVRCFTRGDWIVVFSNVLFFMVVQTAFFWYIASRQYENVLISKLEMFKLAAQKNSTFKRKLKTIQEEYTKKYKSQADQLAKEREKINKELTWKYCGKLIVVVSGIIGLLVLSYFFVKGKSWNNVDTLNMLFVTLAYCTELFFFFFIVRKYEFVGDNYILTNLFQNILNDETSMLDLLMEKK
jgi:hypothetical protein